MIRYEPGNLLGHPPATDAWFAASAFTAYDLPVRGAYRWTFIELRDATGLTGIAEVTCRDSALAASLAAKIAGRIRGERVSSDAALVSMAGITDAALQSDFILATAFSAVRSAVADALSRRAALSMSQYLRAGAGVAGQPPAEVRLYANINRALLSHAPSPAQLGAGAPANAPVVPADRSPDGFAEVARRAVADGFDAVKCAPFDECRAPFRTRGLPDETGPGLERVRAVRDAIGPGRRLLVDCHSRFDVDSATAVATELAGLGVTWFEEPLDPFTNRDGLRLVRESAGIPVAGGENGYGAEAFNRLADSGAADIVMPDIKHCGGVEEGLRIARSLESERPGSVSFHCPTGPVSLLGSAHVTAAFAGVAGPLPLEHAVYEADWRQAVLSPAENIRKGAFVLPGGPGLGASLDYSTILKAGRRWEP
jgi:galactonate dehydratase